MSIISKIKILILYHNLRHKFKYDKHSRKIKNNNKVLYM